MHDCIHCGCACYCHGDIDDCVVETVEYAYEHCEGCGCDPEPDSGWPDDERDETPTEKQPDGIDLREHAEAQAHAVGVTGSRAESFSPKDADGPAKEVRRG